MTPSRARTWIPGEETLASRHNCAARLLESGRTAGSTNLKPMAQEFFFSATNSGVRESPGFLTAADEALVVYRSYDTVSVRRLTATSLPDGILRELWFDAIVRLFVIRYPPALTKVGAGSGAGSQHSAFCSRRRFALVFPPRVCPCVRPASKMQLYYHHQVVAMVSIVNGSRE